jgi:hypothetical protein
VLPNQVHDAPPAIPLLDVPECECRHFRPAQPAAQKHGEDRAVAKTFRGRDVRRIQQRLSLLDREPIPQADALGGSAPMTLQIRILLDAATPKSS